MTFRIAVDTGGTFTDLALSDGGTFVGTFKSPTTPREMVRGVVGALGEAAAHVGLSVEELLERTEQFVYATTRSTNAILEGDYEPPAFLTTEGHRDILLYREGGKSDPFDLAVHYPPPFVPRWLTFEVPERILADGGVHRELDADAVAAIADRLSEVGVRSAGVCLLWSVANPSHELRVAEILAARCPGVDVTLSHRLNPIMREYRRASATVINAALKPLMSEHLDEIDSELRALGFRGEPLMVTHTSGGMMPFRDMSEQPIHTVDSGPAMAPVAGRAAVAADGGEEDAIVVDTGGTSFDVSLVRDGAVGYTGAKWLGDEWVGHMTGMSAVDTRSVGSGGGSIASVDSAGLLRVGPESAGADPGPVCYGRGGTRPTVTDAALVLGLVDPRYFLGGRIELDLRAAEDALARDVAEPLGLGLHQAAEGVLRVATDAMANLVREVTIGQGLDPRESVIVAGGGASGLNIVEIARELRCPEVLIPQFASCLSAVGGLFSDLVHETSRAFFTTTAAFDRDGAGSAIDELGRELDGFFAGIPESGREARELSVDARYAHQAWELEVRLDGVLPLTDDAAVERLATAFHDAHQQTFAVRDDAEVVECVNWRARGWQVLDKPALAPRPVAEGSEPSRRPVYIGGGMRDVAVHRAHELRDGERIAGPAIVEEPSTTVVVPPGATLRVTPSGQYRIATGEPTAGATPAVGAASDEPGRSA
ncbi:MAG: hydantoinase/oxoprolinase family protein [Thermoleophilaceae bacterium]